ncbi:MAG: ferrochelatase [Casimicrobiaceae bacterium]|nr:ferrochelatase [Casimicrobiaceae bacterium]
MLSRFVAEPPHGQASRIGIILCNLGTPAAPTPRAVRAYLREFLSDPRVVEIPRLLWWPILHGIILPTRPSKSAAKYAKVWLPEGSPLLVWTERQAQYLRGELGERLKARGLPWDLVHIEVGMRYGEPSLASAWEKLRAQRCDRLLLLPLYPQYASSTTGSACAALFRLLERERHVPAVRTVRSWHDDPDYIGALAASVRRAWQQYGRPQVLVMSFHGVPRFALERGDPYHCLCQKTGRLLAEALGLDSGQYRIAFQSRFGRAEWLRPYTDETLESLARTGVRSVHVICPGFPADCLETLEEIAIEGRERFLAAGGSSYYYIPALNDSAQFVRMLARLAEDHLSGWLAAPPDREQLALQLARARALGAPA